MNIRHLEEGACDSIIHAIDDWFDGRPFLGGFVSQTYPEQAYIHFVGIDPRFRRGSLGRQLYERFFETVRRRGCTTIRCITSPVNTGSIVLPKRMGFEIEGVSGEHQGVPCTVNYELNGQHRVQFVKMLS